MNLRGIIRGGLLVIGVGCIVGGIGYYYQLHRDDLPELPMDDVGPNRIAGEVQYTKGEPSLSVLEGGQYSPIKQSSTFFIGSTFKLPGGAFAQIKTNGNYMIAMDGDGEFVFQQAKTSPEHSRHTAFWTIRRGTLRAKPHDWDPSEHLLEVRTAKSRIIAHNSEFGLRVDDAGSGQIWVIKGKVRILWKDGKSRDLNEKGMDYL